MGLALKCRRGVPYACYVHGEEVNIASTSRELSFLARRVLGGADFLIANSQNTRQILMNEWGVPDSAVRLLNPGVDTFRFQPAERNAEVRMRLGWGDRPVLLTVGRLQRRKGQDQLILALNRIRTSFPDILYAIIGDGEDLSHLQGLVASEDLERHVQFLGEVKDAQLVECYQQCDLFVLPNRAVGKDIEGFGMVLLEAQACGRPVLAGTSGGTAETMRIPETGYVVPCDGPHELAALVVKLLGNPGQLQRMGSAARAHVVGRFDWSALSQQAEGIFHSGQGQSR